MKKWNWKLKFFWRRITRLHASLLLMLLFSVGGYGQDGVAGINEANQKVRSYFDAGTELMYAVGAILGLIGAVKVYQKWNAGDPDTGKVAAAWFGSCVFLVVVATVIKSFFGV
ncbi:carbamoyl phosphate synthetase [Flavobacterium johnsoniae]|uniref:Carbamoyl phosphate synthetase n=2 Tax=Flavobacterium johnsoniae TaxID=986 RepID=A0A1J7BNS5_FLAJO|nr:carbamoyl phosphate synthetase [Flavobacterium johnsoniae]